MNVSLHLLVENLVDQALRLYATQALESIGNDGGSKVSSSGSRTWMACMQMTLINDLNMKSIKVRSELLFDPFSSVHQSRSIPLLDQWPQGRLIVSKTPSQEDTERLSGLVNQQEAHKDKSSKKERAAESLFCRSSFVGLRFRRHSKDYPACTAMVRISGFGSTAFGTTTSKRPFLHFAVTFSSSMSVLNRMRRSK